MKSVLKRLLLSAVVVMLYGWINALLSPVATIMSAQMAGKQFENSDVSYVVSSLGMNFFGNVGVSALALLAVLVWIWWAPLKALIKSIGDDSSTPKAVVAVLVASGIAFGMVDNALAYYDKSNYTEAYFILPNESAFFIPDVGANKDSQVAFGSEQYYAANKIPAKRYEIPHVKLENSGLWSNYYVPSSRLIIVNRAPYSREWTASATRGTAKKDESLPCQSSEGIDVTTEIAIATSITETDAAKYLYFFGVEPPAGNRAEPAVIFTSVFHARDLNVVMDNVVRTKIQGLICKQIGSRTLDKVNADSTAIMDAAEGEVKKFLTTRGITLDAIGWAGTFSFGREVQKAIDDRFIAATVAGSIPTLQKLADIDVRRGLAKGLETKGLPSFLPPGLTDWLGKLLGMDSTPAAAPSVKK